jgi:hypothetical protein
MRVRYYETKFNSVTIIHLFFVKSGGRDICLGFSHMHRNASSLLATIMHSFLLGKR